MHIKKHPILNKDINIVMFFSTSTFLIIAFAILSLHVLGGWFCSSVCDDSIFSSFFWDSFLFLKARFFILFINFV